jgi:hypothetical protein
MASELFQKFDKSSPSREENSPLAGIQKKNWQDNSRAEDMSKRALKSDEIMKRMKIEKFKKIGQMWIENSEGITMPHFVLLISNFAQHEPQERLDLMNGAIKLFEEIDINGDRKVEWSEFV